MISKLFVGQRLLLASEITVNGKSAWVNYYYEMSTLS